MAYLFNGATHKITRASSPIAAWPLTLFGRVRLTDHTVTSANHCIGGLFATTLGHCHVLFLEFVGGVWIARCRTVSGGGFVAASSSTSFGDNNWHTVIGEVTADNARQVWLDNGGNGSNASVSAPATLNRTFIGANETTGGALVANVGHEVADFAAWAGTLAADDRAALNAGISPALIRPDIRGLYWPGLVAEPDWDGDPFTTITGATKADHPRVFMPAPRQIIGVPAAAGNITVPTGRADETDSAFALAASLIGSTGLASETDTALALAAVLTSAPGMAVETDTALAVAAQLVSTPGIASETDTALALAALLVSTPGIAAETDTAFGLAALLVVATGRADETDTAFALAPTTGPVTVATGRADEFDTAFALLLHGSTVLRRAVLPAELAARAVLSAEPSRLAVLPAERPVREVLPAEPKRAVLPTER